MKALERLRSAIAAIDERVDVFVLVTGGTIFIALLYFGLRPILSQPSCHSEGCAGTLPVNEQTLPNYPPAPTSLSRDDRSVHVIGGFGSSGFAPPPVTLTSGGVYRFTWSCTQGEQSQPVGIEIDVYAWPAGPRYATLKGPCDGKLASQDVTVPGDFYIVPLVQQTSSFRITWQLQ